jgi:hypothetical protein
MKPVQCISLRETARTESPYDARTPEKHTKKGESEMDLFCTNCGLKTEQIVNGSAISFCPECKGTSWSSNPPRVQCGQPERDQILMGALDNEIVYYGPHPCDLCGQGLIAKSGNGWKPVYRFDYPHPPVYPNAQWREHVCYSWKVDADGYFDSQAV